ncbi:hypothetical protein DPMN_016593 [Dreissena polymorpha]|uniref:Uncharacterized protein n=1 Tax=Dreissena polymorpha TaxID=45954 RepID=A0A9D4NBJ0_DREPO|nr:hypothetical protein DPMN_016593 [Dreissena polymorpha]
MAYTCFECGKGLCYKLLTTFCGICIALGWGCDFAMIAFTARLDLHALHARLQYLRWLLPEGVPHHSRLLLQPGLRSLWWLPLQD